MSDIIITRGTFRTYCMFLRNIQLRGNWDEATDVEVLKWTSTLTLPKVMGHIQTITKIIHLVNCKQALFIISKNLSPTD